MKGMGREDVEDRGGRDIKNAGDKEERIDGLIIC